MVALGALAGCQSAQTTAAHKIADALPRSIGPAAHYDVQVEGDTLALTRGRARRIHVVGQEVQVAPDTTLDVLDIDAHDVSFDTDAKKINKVGRAAFRGTVGQQNLTEYLAHRRPWSRASRSGYRRRTCWRKRRSPSRACTQRQRSAGASRPTRHSRII